MAKKLTHAELDAGRHTKPEELVNPDDIANTSGIHPEEETETDFLAVAAGIVQDKAGNIKGLLGSSKEDERFLTFLSNTYHSSPEGSDHRRMALLAINALAAREILAEA